MEGADANEYWNQSVSSDAENQIVRSGAGPKEDSSASEGKLARMGVRI
jgi:hypothetical protein